MISNKTKRMLYLLDGMVEKCELCSLYQNGRAKPYWTENYEGYFIVGEAPGKDEIANGEPFIGKAGSILWDIMNSYGYKKEQFLMINSVNCRPVVAKRNGKPTEEQMHTCREWISKYLGVLKPFRGILLGSYAAQTMLNIKDSVIAFNASVATIRMNDINTPLVPVIRSVHPAYSIYSEEGKVLLEESVKALKMLR
jgi:uracil-DNA glycosylase family 4